MYFLLLSHVLPSISNRWFYLYFLLFTNRRFYLYSNWGVQMFWNLKIRPYFRRNSENWWVQFRSSSKILGCNCILCTPLKEVLNYYEINDSSVMKKDVKHTFDKFIPLKLKWSTGVKWKFDIVLSFVNSLRFEQNKGYGI